MSVSPSLRMVSADLADLYPEFTGGHVLSVTDYSFFSC